MKDFVYLENVQKYYHMGSHTIAAADGISFSVDKGEFCVIVGPSGSGKTTMLNIIGGMDSGDGGIVMLDNLKVHELNERQLTNYRRYDVGFVFQFYNLIQNLTALENVELASQISKNPLDPKEVIKQVGLGDRMDNFPAQLSGGEQQRVSIARALAKNPKILLCDEPTGALDSKTGVEVLRVLKRIHEKYKKTVIIITHNVSIANMADRVIRLSSGRVIEDYRNDNPIDVDRIEW